jgi:hypothetical protein
LYWFADPCNRFTERERERERERNYLLIPFKEENEKADFQYLNH